MLIGSSGYIGSAFHAQMKREEISIIIANQNCYYDIRFLVNLLSRSKPDVVINCAAYTGINSVADCDSDPEQTFSANSLLPSALAETCEFFGIPLLHISTGCLFDEKREYTEKDYPTRDPGGHCGTYIGSKLIAEKAVLRYEKSWVLRIRLPFDEHSHPRNYLTKLAKFSTVYDHINSLTHRGDFVNAALHLIKTKAPYGLYHCANPGQVSAYRTLGMMTPHGLIKTMPEIVPHKTAGCRLNVEKLLSTGAVMRPVEEALEDAMKNWKTT